MGGLFLHTPNPPSEGAIIELLFDLKAGEVRARAVVRHHTPGKGMGVQFVQMQAADRARLNQFLSKYSAAEPVSQGAVESQAAAPPYVPKNDEVPQFERELTSVLELTRKGTYYQVLGVSPDSTAKQIKQSFYALAQKFHPDHHMENQERMGRLKELMGVATTAYKTLGDEEQLPGRIACAERRPARRRRWNNAPPARTNACAPGISWDPLCGCANAPRCHPTMPATMLCLRAA